MNRIPAPALFLTAGVSMYYGAALAVGLFAVAPAVSVGWARLVVAAVVLLLLARPCRINWTARTLGVAAAFGLLLGAMNLLFYAAIKHLPLGAAVAIEFTGPVAVAVATATTSWRGTRLVAPLLAAAGVAAIGWNELHFSRGGESVLGVVLALAAGAAWAGYMLLGRLISGQPAEGDADGADGAEPSGAELRGRMASLAVGMAAAALGYAVLGLPGAHPLAEPRVLALVLGVGVLSSVIPYVLDQVAMSRLSTSTFALLNALLPATAVLVGLVSLGQTPSWFELVGVLAISAAVALATRSNSSPARVPEAPPQPGA